MRHIDLIAPEVPLSTAQSSGRLLPDDLRPYLHAVELDGNQHACLRILTEPSPAGALIAIKVLHRLYLPTPADLADIVSGEHPPLESAGIPGPPVPAAPPQIRPQRRVRADVCSICDQLWAHHPQPEATLEDCILALRRELEQARATIRAHERQHA